MKIVPKFRAWDKEEKEWIYADGFNKPYYFWQWLYEQDSETRKTLGQWTGYLDKNEKEIYEGDIVIGAYGAKFVVSWCTHYDHDEVEWAGWNVSESYANKDEVIGNMVESPELLSKK